MTPSEQDYIDHLNRQSSRPRLSLVWLCVFAGVVTFAAVFVLAACVGAGLWGAK
jgi:hypothetical protein